MNVEEIFELICTIVDEEKEFLNSVGQYIWEIPELQYKEVHAHAILTSSLKKYGFYVHKHYFLPTAFRAEYSSKSAGGPTIAILLEYDALPGMGHACGHNLIAETGLAAAVAIKAVMDENPKISGKLVVLGTPAEEDGGGTLRLIELGAFESVDAALTAHPFNKHLKSPATTAKIKGSAQFRSRESHACSYPLKGKNALDAAVACYIGISLLRQEMVPGGSINAIITDGGTTTSLIPAKSRMEFLIISRTSADRKRLQSEVEACTKGAATLTGCSVSCNFDEDNAREDLVTNKVLINLYEKYATKLGIEFDDPDRLEADSIDMGNVSHLVPTICPFYGITSNCEIHTEAFNQASGSEEAKEEALKVSKAIAMVAISLMYYPNTLRETKEEFSESLHAFEKTAIKLLI